MKHLFLIISLLVLVGCGAEIESPEPEPIAPLFWIAAGQSNMAGETEFLEYTNNVQAMDYSANDPRRGKAGFQPLEGMKFSSVAGHFAIYLSYFTERPVYVAEIAEGSSKISSWMVGGYWYENNVLPFQTFRPDGVIWWQGESDALDKGSRAYSYENNLNEMIRQWRHLFRNSDLPFILTELQTYNQSDEKWEAVHDAILNVAVDVDNVSIALTQDITDGDLHPINQYAEIGLRLAYEAYLMMQARGEL